MEGLELTFEDEVLDLIVEKAWEYKLGARGLRNITEAIMLDAMYEIPSEKTEGEKEFNVSLDYALGKLKESNLNKLRVA